MSTFSYKREYINLYLVNKAINKLANTYKDNITLTELFNLCNPSVILPKVITFQMDHFILWHFKESVTSPINYCDLYFTIEKNNDKNRYQLSLLIINCINKLTYNEPFKDYIAAGPTSIEKVTWFINYLKEKVLLTYNNHILESIVDLVNQVDSKFILIQTPTRYEEYEFDGKSPTYLTTYVYRILIDECLNNMSYQKISQLIKN